jgi:hypothetical protein
MLETGLGMCCQMRLSELLRRTAESTVQMMVRVVFSRLSSIDAPPLPEALPTSTSSGPASTPSEVEVLVAPMDPAGLELGGTATVESAIESAVEHSHLSPEDYPPPFSPYGSPTTTELVRVLITLLNPLDNQHTDSMRLAALSILQTALETAGHHIGRFHEMRSMLSDEGCKYLFQLTRSDSPNLLSASLRVTSTLFATQREHLKPQLELFLSYLIDRLTPPPSLLHRSLDQSSISGSAASSVAPSEEPSTPSSRPSVGFGLAAQGESRHLLLEALASLARQPSFLVDLWVNYDCDMDCEDLFEKTVGFLTRVSLPFCLSSSLHASSIRTDCFLPISLSNLGSLPHCSRSRTGRPDRRPDDLPRHPSLLGRQHGSSNRDRRYKLARGTLPFFLVDPRYISNPAHLLPSSFLPSFLPSSEPSICIDSFRPESSQTYPPCRRLPLQRQAQDWSRLPRRERPPHFRARSPSLKGDREPAQEQPEARQEAFGRLPQPAGQH